MSIKTKPKIVIIIHYDKSAGKECYGDYDAVSVWINDKKIKEFGDYYHDKGEEKAESFAEGYALAKGWSQDAIETKRKNDRNRL